MTRDEIYIGHWKLYQENVLHRDISNFKLLFYREYGRVIGILNDFDLSVILEGSNKTAPTVTSPSKHRTRTGTFMALDLLDSKYHIGHSYRHDVESFFYVLVWIAVGYKGYKSSHQVGPLEEWKGTWDTTRTNKSAFLCDEIKYERIKECIMDDYAKLRPLIFKFKTIIGDAMVDALRSGREFLARQGTPDDIITESALDREASTVRAAKMTELITWERVSAIFDL